jgi:hypothetical protein
LAVARAGIKANPEGDMDRFCANEDDYHQRVIQNMGGLPEVLKSQDGVRAFVWGHEVDLHDAGRGGGNGSADLLTADEYGMVWLIEAKFDKTSEKGDFVWGSQLRRYKEAIGRMEWQDVLLYVSKFLSWREKTKPAFNIPSSTETFTRVLEIWQAQIGRALITPGDLNNRIAAHLKYATYGIMILTDIDDDSYEEYGRNFVHEGPLAYVLGTPSTAGIEYHVRWYKPGADCTRVISNAAAFSLRPAARPLCTPDTFAVGLSESSRGLWSEILQPGLLALEGEFRNPSDMGFEVLFRIGDRLLPLLLIGWPERDDKNVPREQKIFGSASMRVDVHIKRLYEASGRDTQRVNNWMQKSYARGWRGRPSKGMRERWGVSPVSDEELNSKIHGIMRYLPQLNLSCHTGRPGDADNLHGLLADLTEVLQELRRAPTARTGRL